MLLSLSIPGAYNPVTREGTLIVDGVHVSCYGSFDHYLAHMFMGPFRWLSYWFNLGDDNLEGTLPYIVWIKTIGRTYPLSVWHDMLSV